MAAMLISAQAVDYDGAVLSGAKLNVYDAGTNPPRAIYASKEHASGDSSANPAVATATGGIAVWVDDSAGDIKITLTNSAGTTTYYSQDNIDPTIALSPVNGSVGPEWSVIGIADDAQLVRCHTTGDQVPDDG